MYLMVIFVPRDLADGMTVATGLSGNSALLRRESKAGIYMCTGRVEYEPACCIGGVVVPLTKTEDNVYGSLTHIRHDSLSAHYRRRF